MVIKTKAPSMSQLRQQLLKAIDEAGDLQRACHSANVAYDSKRKEVEELIRKTQAFNGEGITVQASKYQASLVYDEVRHIDPIEFIKKVKDSMIRQLCLKVVLKDAETVLKKLNAKLFYELVTMKKKEVVTLYIEQRS